MPYGTPTEGTTDTYSIVFHDVLTTGQEYHVLFDVRPDVVEIDRAQAETVVQQFVDLIASSPNFVLQGASRTTPYYTQITPSV